MIAARRWLSTLAAVLVIGVWAVSLRPQSLGGPALYVIIRGDSMLPTYTTGDLVIFRPAEAYAIGDSVAYRVPSGQVGAGRVVVHRIIGGDAVRGYVMQGDNNPSIDPWEPTRTNIAGSAWLTLPGVGLGLAAIREPVVLAALAASLVVALAVARRPTHVRVVPASPAAILLSG